MAEDSLIAPFGPAGQQRWTSGCVFRRYQAILGLTTVLLGSTLASARAVAQSDGSGASAGADLEDLIELLETPIDVALASTVKEGLRTAPAVVDVVSAPDFERWGYRTVGEALTHIVGFYLVDDHTVPNLTVRGVSGGLGAESGIVKVLIDGRSVNFRPTSGAWLGVELVPLTAVERIEIIRGPASAMYGADAFLGVINVVTRTALERSGVTLRALSGKTGDAWGVVYDGSLQLKGDSWGLLMSLAGEQADRSGLFLPDSSPAPRRPDYNEEARAARGLERRSTSAYGKFEYAVDRFRGLRALTVSTYYSAIQRGGDFAPWSQLSHGLDQVGRVNGTLVSLDQHSVAVDSQWRLSPTFDAVIAAGYFAGRSRDDERIEVNSDLFFVRRNLASRGLDTKLELLWSARENLGLVFGGELTNDWERAAGPTRVLKSDLSALSPPEEGAHTLGNLGVYAQSHLSLYDDSLTITAGLRMDEHFFYGPQLTGRLALVLSWNKDLVFKLLYGSAFKAPSPQLLFAEPLAPGGLVGNTRLKPQYVHTTEYNASYSFAKYFYVTSGLAYSILMNKAEFVAQGINQTAKNVARVHAFSWESSLNIVLREDLRAYSSLDVQRTYRKFGQEGYLTQIAGSNGSGAPLWMARSGVGYRFPAHARFSLQINGEGRWVSPRRATDSNILENGAIYELPSYLDLGGSVSMVKLFLVPNRETIISLRGYDLLNRISADPGYGGVDYPRVGRELYIELRQEY